MKIGIDLDGVIFDTEKEFKTYAEIYDFVDLKQNKRLDNMEFRFQDRFAWSQDELNGFLKRYHKQIIQEVNYLPGVKRVLKKLKQEGNSLILITARGGLNKDMIKLTQKRFKQEDMEIFDKYYWATENKDEVCIKEKVDVMIDDYYLKCINIANKKIKTIYLKDVGSPDVEENEYIKVMYNWGEIYRYLKELEI